MTKRDNKKEKKRLEKANEIVKMTSVLERKWNCSFVYSCEYCLREAYSSVVEDRTGYVTDEELINCSGNSLQHK